MGVFDGPTASGVKARTAKTWKYCPYSTQITNYNGDTRVPEIEKVYHNETDGRMHSYSISGVMGWACADNDCPFFLGTATTEIQLSGRKFVPSSGTCAQTDPKGLTGNVIVVSGTRSVVSGTRFIEI
jgi:hypothetical protein